MADKLKLAIAALVLIAGMAGFYLLSEYSTLMRTLGLLALVGVSAAIALQTEIGQAAWGFIVGARTEARKVVWPTRKETTQTTLLVVVMVVIVGILLWLLDMGLVWAVRVFTGA
ncbi:MAG: preprotein translocase subunit SecE [Gammaproteobacteria bacterium]|jgi:preprotein translocase subunit SecE|nr:preprotein translocase subunit SecE [Gammaproteobacteria bacterium]MBT4607476.1 preprotein translocase subunit SecE [Thiotrichales bacterium]MBT3967272.1 preprotein translocase subunit SecE [Gammaproteobacteria bacterium]MBT4082060.1 preprotein translocase subunit SecE [Gammaproteobacteria bacterium]MBT4330893.1 preprotein translocase subunit SecE [Gammaproteobacteria bacterium]